jgi:hypothetical protein
MLASEMNLADNALQKEKKKREIFEEASADLWDRMNFREKYLGGWFGGDKHNVRQYRTLERDIANMTDRIDHLGWEKMNFDHLIGLLVHSELSKNDPVFQKLLEPYQEASDMKSEIDKFVESIQNALKEVDDAQSTETMDLLSGNKAISLLSHMENDEASMAIRNVGRMIPLFQKALTEYNGFIKNYEAPTLVEIDDFTDLMFDLALDGFDFMSIFTLSAIDEAENALREALQKVEEVDKIVTDHLAKAEVAHKTYFEKAREAALR